MAIAFLKNENTAWKIFLTIEHQTLGIAFSLSELCLLNNSPLAYFKNEANNSLYKAFINLK